MYSIILVAIIGFIVIFILCKLISVLREKSTLPRPVHPNDTEANLETQTPADVPEDKKKEDISTTIGVNREQKIPDTTAGLQQSQKSTVLAIHTSDDSLRSKKSTGFIPTLKSVFPVNTSGRKGSQNFLMLLDSLDALDDKETEKRNQPTTAASYTDIEASSSDETASQTLIGRELGNNEDPGRIKLNLIKSDDPN